MRHSCCRVVGVCLVWLLCQVILAVTETKSGSLTRQSQILSKAHKESAREVALKAGPLQDKCVLPLLSLLPDVCTRKLGAHALASFIRVCACVFMHDARVMCMRGCCEFSSFSLCVPAAGRPGFTFARWTRRSGPSSWTSSCAAARRQASSSSTLM